MTNTEHTKTKPCKFCTQLFEYKRKTAEFCTEAHKKAWQRARTTKLDKQRKYRFSTSAFTFYLADSCRRSGTIEVLPKTLSELEKLHRLYKYSLRSNDYGEDDQFSLCHIFPVQHPHYIGSMHAANLCVSYRDLNSKHSNGFVPNAGHKISRLHLSPQWRVDAEDSKTSVVAKIVEYYGEDFTATIAVKLKLQPTKRQASLDWLTQCNDPRVPAHAELEAMTTVALTKLKSEISEKSGGWLPDSGINANDVFLSELKRVSEYRPEFEQVAERWLEVMPEVFDDFEILHYSRPKRGGSAAEYKEALAPIASLRQAQFNLLHGGNVEDFLNVLNTYKTTPDVHTTSPEALGHLAESLVLPIASEFCPAKKVENKPVSSNTPDALTPVECSAFTHADYQELAALELQSEADTELSHAFMGQRSKAEQQRGAWQRFIS